MQVNVQFLQQLQPEDLDTVSYHKLFDVLKQYKKEVNEIHAKRIAKNANPLSLVASAQQYPDSYYQAPKSHKSIAQPSKQSSFTRSSTPTKFKGKEIAKPITPPFESASEEDKDNDCCWGLGNCRQSGSKAVWESFILHGIFGHFARNAESQKRLKTVHRNHIGKYVAGKQLRKVFQLPSRAIYRP
ncbi:hypothetical protein Tco_0726423 [Tanacetum coccineum]|uniref:Uncharacterized protein n=1 Tax=Tanacetum coccineum TaxID=301880 RepID=A0ABQ4YI39_9ASTR